MNQQQEYLILDALDRNVMTDKERDIALRALAGNEQAQSKIIPRLSARRLSGYNPVSPTVSVGGRKKKDENFDYETGADSTLRSLISFGETAEEQERMLLKLVGKEGYTKDSYGRLALTETGQKLIGIDYVGKNLVLEDEGFSFGDIADLAGLLPETVGSVIGGVLGAGSGLGFGSVVTGAAGAAAGAAVGQTVEESIEAMMGLQAQTLPEITKDVLTEAAIAGSVDLVTVGTFKAVRGLLGGATKLATKPSAEAIEGQGERALRLIDQDAAPSLGSMGAPAMLRFSQDVSEGATGSLFRQFKNTDFALKESEKFRLLVNQLDQPLERGVGVEEAADVFSDVTGRRFKELKAAQKEAENSALKAVRDSIDVITRSNKEGFDINTEALNSLTAAFQNFSRVSGNEFKIMDDMLSSLKFGDDTTDVLIEGGKARVVPTGILEGAVQDIIQATGSRSILDSSVQKAIAGIEDLAKSQKGFASFEQIANQRKLVNDLLFTSEMGEQASKHLFKLRNAFDESLNAVNLNSIKGIRPDQGKLFSEIADQRDRAFATYREGLKAFDDLREFGILNSIKKAQQRPELYTDRFFDAIIQPGRPERFKAFLRASDDPELIRSQLARAYLDNAMTNTGIDLMNPSQFNGMRFKQNIDRLGTAGKELFGEQWGEVKNLANTIAQAGPNKIDADVVSRIAQVSPDSSLIGRLNELAEAKAAYGEVLKTKVLRDFSNGTLSPEDAARYLVNPSRTATEINKFKAFFGQDAAGQEALETIRRYAINDIVSTVGDDVFSSASAPRQLDNVLKSYRDGALDALLNTRAAPNTAEDLRRFAGDLVFLADKGNKGGLVANTYAANPFSKLQDRARMGFTANFFASPKVMRFFANRQIRRDNPVQARQRLKSAFTVAADIFQMSNRVGRHMLFQGLQQAGQKELANLERRKQMRQENTMPIQTPQPVQSSGIGAVDVTEPVAPVAPTPPTSTRSPLQTMAATDPEVARTLGIGFKNLELLNR